MVGTMTEDYVKVVWKAHEWSGEGLTTNELAATLGVAASSVSGNLKKLARDGFLDYEAYGRATLTPKGRTLALQVVRRHRLLETWLVEQHGYSWDEVHDEAEVLEHSVSERLLASIDEQLGFPERDPHGDPIPRADGTLVSTTGVRLHDVEIGVDAVAVRVSDHDADLLRYLGSLSIAVGTRLRVEARHDFAGSLSVVVGAGAGAGVGAGSAGGGSPAAAGRLESAAELAHLAANAIWVSRA
ncbi:metal-dependent transcriptional regulator [Frondihabitans cladoniiphilus]|uniref:Manganese transport regulator n=1 Tax=Frondihabitans cladoniiphilus TaxID=715785 RepID=A0ABP8W5Q2_9MICO